MNRVLAAATLFGLLLGGSSMAADPPALALEAKILLGTVKGRIDHMALDSERRILFVAELGNDSVAVVDLEGRKVVHRIGELNEPQGVAWHAATGTLYVANAGDGSVRLFQGSDFAPIGRIDLGSDADNIRLDPWRNRIVVGYGKGALAMIDPTSRRKIGELALDGHPESFQFDETGTRVFVNVPDADQIAGLNAVTGRKVTLLERAGAGSNFAMAVDPDQHRLIVVFRNPARLVSYDMASGKRDESLETCRDADDVFVDARRRRLYVSCGEGAIDVFGSVGGAGYERIARIPTVAGARTSLFVPESDRFYVAVRATASQPAAIWVFRAGP
jgi:DNA-binding beta-propeller fold protein YncE